MWTLLLTAFMSAIALVGGAANVYRVPRSREAPEVCLTGSRSSSISRSTGQAICMFSSTRGSLVRVAPGSSVASELVSGMCARYASGERTTIVTGLTNPTAIAVGPDDALYVSNRGGGRRGQVIRFDR